MTIVTGLFSRLVSAGATVNAGKDIYADQAYVEFVETINGLPGQYFLGRCWDNDETEGTNCSGNLVDSPQTSTGLWEIRLVAAPQQPAPLSACRPSSADEDIYFALTGDSSFTFQDWSRFWDTRYRAINITGDFRAHKTFNLRELMEGDCKVTSIGPSTVAVYWYGCGHTYLYKEV